MFYKIDNRIFHVNFINQSRKSSRLKKNFTIIRIKVRNFPRWNRYEYLGTTIESVLKSEEIWTVIIPGIMGSGKPARDRWKRRILHFETLSHLYRYDFRFPRYRRLKKTVIFDRLLSPSSSLTRTSRSRLADLSQTADKWQTRFLEEYAYVVVSRKKCRSRAHS